MMRGKSVFPAGKFRFHLGRKRRATAGFPGHGNREWISRSCHGEPGRSLRRYRSVKIILANPRGFCAGVNMAIESLERALELYGTPLYVYHEIVHNRPVVERFRGLGVIFVDHISEVPNGGTVMYSAHGVAPAIRAASAERNLRAI